MTRWTYLLLSGAVLLYGALAWRAWQGAAAEIALRDRQVARVAMDEVERAFQVWLGAEESRSFLEYRTVYTPPLVASVGVVCSPLARTSAQEGLLGYFQVDPDGSLSIPAEPRMRDGTVPAECLDPQAAAGAPALRTLLAGVRLDAPEPTASPVEPVMGSWTNLGIRSRSAQTYKSKVTQVAQYVDNQASPVLAVGDEIDVLVAPFRGVRDAAGHLVLVRNVRVGAGLYQQGLVLDAIPFAEAITRAALESSPDPVTVRWSLPERTDPLGEDQTRLGSPFSPLLAEVELPGRGGRDPRPGIAAVGLLGLFMGLSSLLLVRRTTRAELDLAMRRTNFVSAVSHELKTPLTAIRMYAEMLRDGMVPAEDRKHTYYVTIAAESERLSRLIQNVLDLGRIERGTWRADVTVGEVAPVLDRLVEVMGPFAQAKGFTLEVSAAPGLPPVRLDADALLQVLVNLVENAVKFASEAELRTIRVRAEREGGVVAIRVRDHGPGVAPGTLPRIFDLFFRGEQELVRTTRGTGIGLALARGLVTRMGGSVDARNHPEGGLEVRVRLVGG